MRFERFGLLLSFLFLSTSASAQQAQPAATSSAPTLRESVLGPPELLTAPVRDPAALDVVQKALMVMGGPAIAAVQDLTIQARSDAAADPQAISGTMTWKMAGAEFRIDGPGPNGTASVLTGHGRPVVINGATKAVPTYVTQALFVPVAIAPVLAQELANPKMSFRLQENRTLGTESVTVVMTALEMDYPDNVVTPQTWYFDTSTGLPVRVEFRSPDVHQATNFVPSAVDLSDYIPFSGVTYPRTVISSVEGKTELVFKVQSIVINSGTPPTTFDSQGGVL